MKLPPRGTSKSMETSAKTGAVSLRANLTVTLSKQLTCPSPGLSGCITSEKQKTRVAVSHYIQKPGAKGKKRRRRRTSAVSKRHVARPEDKQPLFPKKQVRASFIERTPSVERTLEEPGHHQSLPDGGKALVLAENTFPPRSGTSRTAGQALPAGSGNRKGKRTTLAPYSGRCAGLLADLEGISSKGGTREFFPLEKRAINGATRSEPQDLYKN